VLLCVLAALSVAHAAHWAVVVAGSNQYYNYRHQADACHAMKLLHKNGIPLTNIINMVYDDIANDPSNPYPGKMFNKPTPAGTPGVDVYAGCQKDYTGTDVTAQNFLYIITGNSTAMSGVGSGKVLKSGPGDNVFIFFTDHGGTGIIAFPSGPFLQATDMNAGLQYMHEHHMYKKLTFYLEACESGSMFQNLLPQNINIYATSASSPDESSWGTYCPPDDSVNGVELNSCLGDLYSVNWMEDADLGVMSETLQAQFLKVQQETTQSHVMQWGETDWTTLPIGQFEGNQGHAKSAVATTRPAPRPKSTNVESRDIKLHTLYYKYARANKKDLAAQHAAARELQAEIEHRVHADNFFANLARTVAGVEVMDKMLHEQVSSPATCGPCCKDVMESIRLDCNGWSDYSYKYTRTVVNLCQHDGHHGERTKHIISTVQSLCH